MNTLEQALGSIEGGRVLDVATGRGSFIHILTETLKSYTGIVGIDINIQAVETTHQAFENENILAVQMDSQHLGFRDESFDTVCISNSLHHLADLGQTLAEMKRVLKRGGRCVISEMYRDEQAETQLTHVFLHHWCATIDSAHGITHNETFTRRQIIGIAEGMGLHNLITYDYAELEGDPHEQETIEQIDGAIDAVLQRAEGLEGFDVFKQQGEVVRKRLHEVGILGSTTLVAVCEKRLD